MDVSVFEDCWNQAVNPLGGLWLPEHGNRVDGAGSAGSVVGDPVGHVEPRLGTLPVFQTDPLLRPVLQEENGALFWECSGSFLAAATAADWNWLHEVGTAAYMLIAFRIAPEDSAGKYYGLMGTNPNTRSHPGVTAYWDNRGTTDLPIYNGYRVVRGRTFENGFTHGTSVAFPGTDYVLEVVVLANRTEARQQFNEPIGWYDYSGLSPNETAYAPLHIGAVPAWSDSRLHGRIYGAFTTNSIPPEHVRAGMVSHMFDRLAAPGKALLSGHFITNQPAQNKRVLLRQWAQGMVGYEHIGAVSPRADGRWQYPIPAGITYDLSYFAEGCAPVVHGPYQQGDG